jgi:hypothetical protein
LSGTELAFWTTEEFDQSVPLQKTLCRSDKFRRITTGIDNVVIHRIVEASAIHSQKQNLCRWPTITNEHCNIGCLFLILTYAQHHQVVATRLSELKDLRVRVRSKAALT